MADALPKAVLFDFDGVIAHTEPFHYRAFMEALGSYGVRLTWEEYIRDYLGYDDKGAIPVALATIGKKVPAEEVRRLSGIKNAAFEKLLHGSNALVPESQGFIHRVSRSRPCVVVSMAQRVHIKLILEQGALADCFSGIVSANDVTLPKPDPQGYVKGLELLRQRLPGLKPSECLVVEDSVPGIQAGRAAGCRVLAVATTHEAGTLTNADAVVKDLSHVDEKFLTGMFAGK